MQDNLKMSLSPYFNPYLSVEGLSCAVCGLEIDMAQIGK